MKSRSMTEQPKYRVIYEYLRQQIKERQLRPGDRLPNENELAAQFQVHRMTVRQAIEILVNDQIVVRKRGKGTFLLREAPAMLTRSLESISTYYDDIIRAGLTPRYTTIDARSKIPSTEVLHNLSLAPETPVVYIKRLMYAQGVPLVIERSYLPLELFPDLLEQSLDTALYKVIHERYDMRLAHSLQELRAVMPLTRERYLLKISGSCPCVAINGTVFNEQGRAVEFTRALYRGDRYIFKCLIGRYLLNGQALPAREGVADDADTGHGYASGCSPRASR